MASQPLVEAINLAKQGKKKEARLAFMEIIKDDPHEVMAYLWLVDLLEGSEEKAALLERCLLLNPQSQMARDALDVVLEQQTPEAYEEYLLPEASMAVYREEQKAKTKRSFRGVLKAFLWIAGILLGALLVILGIRFLPGLLERQLIVTQTAGQSVSAATWTPPATSTPTITPTATPVLPVGFGTPAPPPAALISAYDLSQLEVFSQWGSGIPLAAAWMGTDRLAVLTSRSLDVLDTAAGEIESTFTSDLAIRAGDVCPAQQIAAVQTADEVYQWLSFTGEPFGVQPVTPEGVYQILVFSPDCALLAGITEQHSLTVWRVSDGEAVFQPGSIYGTINALAFSGDHQLIALGTEGNLTWVINTQNGQEISRLVETTQGVDALAFSQDGSLLAMASENDDYLTIWNLEENRRQRTITLSKSGVSALAFGEKDALLAVGYVDGEILLRNEEEREVIGRFSHYRNEISSLSFDEQGDTLLSMGVDGRLLAWETDSQSAKTVFTPSIKGSIFTADITPNGQYLVMAGSDSQIHIFDVASQTEIAAMRGHLGSVWYIDISADGKWLLSGGLDGTVRLWSLETFEQEALLGAHGDSVRGVAFSTDGKLGVSASSDEMVKIWDLTNQIELQTLVGHTDEAQSAFFSADGSTVFSFGNDGTLRKWSVDSGRMGSVMEQKKLLPYLSGQLVEQDLAMIGNAEGEIDVWNTSQQTLVSTLSGLNGEVFSMDVTADFRLLATGSDQGEVFLWDLRAREAIHIQEEHRSPVVSVAFTGNGREFFSVGRDGTVIVWEMSGLPVPVLLHQYQAQVQTAVLNDIEELAAFAGADGSVQMVDLETGQFAALIDGQADTVPNLLAISPGGSYLAAGIEAGKALVVWDLTAGREAFALEEDARVTGLLFEPGGRVLLAARSNHSVERLDIRSGAVLEVLRGHSSPVQVMAFSPNQVTLASGSRDGMIFLWDMDDNSVLHRIHAHAGAVTGLAFSSDGKILYSTGADGKLQTWLVASGSLQSTLADESGVLSLPAVLEAQGIFSAVYNEDQIGFWTNTSLAMPAPMGRFWGELKAQAFSASGDQLVVIDGDGVIQSYQVAESIAPSEEEIAAALATHTPAVAQEETEGEEVSSPSQAVLPAPVYYLSDASGSPQVWRMETDGFTTSQITFEPYPVTSFDVAQGTDHLAFVSNNDLILTDKAGKSRWLIQDGAVFPPNSVEEAQRKAIGDPHFSPDGWRLAYALNGVHLYSILNDSDTQLFENSNIGTEAARIYHPLTFSPGGNNLYLQIEQADGRSLMVVNSWTGEEYAAFEEGPCCQPQINADQDAVYFTGRDQWGNAVGLWLVDIWQDTIEEILPATPANAEQINAWPIQDPLTGELLFFYADHERTAEVSLMMARAADDGTSLLQVIRADSFANLTDVLWAPDASLALISDPLTQELMILFAEDRPSIPLAIQGTMMRWGN